MRIRKVWIGVWWKLYTLDLIKRFRVLYGENALMFNRFTNGKKCIAYTYLYMYTKWLADLLENINKKYFCIHSII